MAKDPGIRKVLVIGSGGIRIGQSAEFDYSGIQALKALREEGIETVLVNPNIATIQTSTEFADKVYLEPIETGFLEAIIERERPDGILLGFGGQTALNAGIDLAKNGILAKYGIRVLGTQTDAIEKTEDRQAFREAMEKVGAFIPPSRAAQSVEQAKAIASGIGFPLILRSAYTLGGLGSRVVWDESQLQHAAEIGIKQSPIGQILVEKYLHHWKEIEYEVVRDKDDNCITVCNMENFDPLGIHTGDSIVVAPSQTLTNYEYHMLRSKAIEIIRSIGIVGECNIQFALDPKSDQYFVIEINARLSRSSALASKATGYPLAHIAAKLAVGYTLPELKNKVTGITTADFEPALDYIVVKVPRWEFQKFKVHDRQIGSQMKSIGEVMAIGRTFEEALQKAVRMLETGKELAGLEEHIDAEAMNDRLRNPTDQRLFAIMQALRSMAVDEISRLTGIDQWFLHRLKSIADFEDTFRKLKITSHDFGGMLKQAKKLGFSDEAIAKMLGVSQEKVRGLRKFHGIRPAVKQIDTLAAEWPARTNYLYLTYHGDENDIDFGGRKKILILGSGPIRIGSSVEFDWCTMNCVWELKRKGYRTMVLNCNPETVSTDYDMSDKLYFDELTLERVMDIIEMENPYAVVTSVGGQTSNNLAYSLDKRGVRLLGTSGKYIDMAEDRRKFSAVLDGLGIAQPKWKSLTTSRDMKEFAAGIGYPVIVRPSYVLSGSAMKVANNEAELADYVHGAVKVSRDYPVVVSKFMDSAKEIEVDGVGDGKNTFIGAISEHIEDAGVHSGDATICIPPVTLDQAMMATLADYSRRIVSRLRIRGPFNIQFLVKDGKAYVIECNLRASRSMPFASKAVNINLISLATECMLGKRLEAQDEFQKFAAAKPYFVVKCAMFSWSRLRGVEPALGVEMASTGEVACFGRTFEEAFLKSMLAADMDTGRKIVQHGMPADMLERFKRTGTLSDDGSMLIDLSADGNSMRREMAERGMAIVTRREIAHAIIGSLEARPELKPLHLKEIYSAFLTKTG
ncbi:MAG: carbamoyl-phosphate synthase (glutamine-hydrolyzing) large subunit [Candidatus Aenigmarchaeota archaeon]|nr:carbamoyl-phosphate synthase (glutamine-hydrolyzing) large subunit [Candidatus Aenigmarchaeota archaeon]